MASEEEDDSPVCSEGWLLTRGLGKINARGAWQRRWCVLRAHSLACYTDEDCSECRGTASINPSTQAHGFTTPAGPSGCKVETFPDQPFVLVVDIDPDDGEDRELCYFDAEDPELNEAWVEAIQLAARNLCAEEAFIDDFSDYEDDKHARKSSLCRRSEIDWTLLNIQAATSKDADSSEEQIRRQQSEEDGEDIVQTTSEGGNTARVTRCDIGDAEDYEENDAARRSSMESLDSLDWTKLTKLEKPAVASDLQASGYPEAAEVF